MLVEIVIFLLQHGILKQRLLAILDLASLTTLDKHTTILNDLVLLLAHSKIFEAFLKNSFSYSRKSGSV